MATKKKISRRSSSASVEELKSQYNLLAPTLERLRMGLVEQLGKVIVDNSLTLAFPIESRIKSWASIAEKISRNSLDLKLIKDLPDLVGIRIVLLFKRDLQTACATVSKTLPVREMEDVASRLGDAQFGYQSVHYGVSLPEVWLTVPTFSGCDGITVELQLRTIAQHTWAAAAHILQYKQESSVPLEVRRSINRVSALLETVDLEFERALKERDEYLQEPDDARPVTTPLNVDLLASTLDRMLPAANWEDEEPYDQLLIDLKDRGIRTLGDLRGLIEKHSKAAIDYDSEIVAGVHMHYLREPERISKGVYLSHVGLVRQMLEFEKEREKRPTRRRS